MAYTLILAVVTPEDTPPERLPFAVANALTRYVHQVMCEAGISTATAATGQQGAIAVDIVDGRAAIVYDMLDHTPEAIAQRVPPIPSLFRRL